MVKQVKWALSAKKQLLKAHNRIKESSSIRAMENTNEILEATRKLSENFEFGTLERLLHKEPKEYRFIVVGFYKIIYSVGDAILIEVIHHLRETPKR